MEGDPEHEQHLAVLEKGACVDNVFGERQHLDHWDELAIRRLDAKVIRV